MGKSLNNIFFLVFATTTILFHSNNCFQLNIKNNISNTIIQYNVIMNTSNLDAIKLFHTEIGYEFAAQVMSNATTFAWQVFNQTDPSEHKYIPKVISFYLSDFEGYGLEEGDNIKISAWYMSTYHSLGNTSKLLFTSIMYHEITHILQSKPNGLPHGLMEGIADYVMVKSGYYQENWNGKRSPGSGKNWDDGYDKTEMFLEYCDSLKKGFTVQLNKMMRYSYSDAYFKEILGKNVSQLWKDYKDKYGNIDDTGGHKY